MPHDAQVAHHVRGRIRVKIPGSRRNPAVLKDVAESLASLHGIEDLVVNPATGSVVIHYDHRAHDNFHDVLTEHGARTGLFALAPPELSEVDQLADNIQREAEFLAAHSETARTIVEAVKALNVGLKRMTGNNVDLKVLLPLGLAGWAVIEHDPEIATPLWLTLSIFSFNSFVSLHAQPAGVAVETQQVIRHHDARDTVEQRTTRKHRRTRT